MRIALVGCSKRKAKVTCPSKFITARDLYSASDLFNKRVAHVESRNLPWFILSAGSALISPTLSMRTYDVALSQFSDIERAEWHLEVANQLMTELKYEFGKPKLTSVVIEFHAGAKYCEPLASILQHFGIKVAKPLAGLGIGEQLAWYSSYRKDKNVLSV